jgi:response regulator RpfG family c-di-GMP phosphodiesterase
MNEPLPYILLIDDDHDDNEMLSAALEQQGLKTRSFESGEKACFFLRLISDTSDLPVLIILDYNMPKINGQQILKFIKSNKDTGRIPVLVYSTHMSPVFRKVLLDSGASECFMKPWSYPEFIIQVQKFKELAFSFITKRNLV